MHTIRSDPEFQKIFENYCLYIEDLVLIEGLIPAEDESDVRSNRIWRLPTIQHPELKTPEYNQLWLSFRERKVTFKIVYYTCPPVNWYQSPLKLFSDRLQALDWLAQEDAPE